MIELFYSQVVAPGELVGIRLEDIDFKHRQMRVIGKQKQRVLFFGKSAETAIRRYVRQRKTGWLFEGLRPEQRGFVWATPKGWAGCWLYPVQTVAGEKSLASWALTRNAAAGEQDKGFLDCCAKRI